MKYYTYLAFLYLLVMFPSMCVAGVPEYKQMCSMERESLSLNQVYDILDRGALLLSSTTIVNSLSQGGTAIFPHASIMKCGDQIAAVVHASLAACQKTGKNQILLIGVVHRLTKALTEARIKELNGIDIFQDPCRGIFGPGLPREELLRKEFSLDHFLFLFQHAVEREGIKSPKIIIRYPNLIYGKPELISGIEELRQLVDESVVVATSDLCHHGVAYGANKEQAFGLSSQGYDFAYRTVEKNLRLLSTVDLMAYRKHCIDTMSDSTEVGQLLSYLLGPLEGMICDLRLVDVTNLFADDVSPSWVAATLAELKPIVK